MIRIYEVDGDMRVEYDDEGELEEGLFALESEIEALIGVDVETSEAPEDEDENEDDDVLPIW